MVARVLWSGLAVAIALTVAVRIHASREEARWNQVLAAIEAGTASPTAIDESAAPAPDPDVKVIGTISPVEAVTANALRLAWDDVPIAAEFRLQIRTIAGDVVVDQLSVEDASWTPPFEVLPALRPGEYVWSVEAVDQDGTALARSLPQQFRIH